MSAAAGADSVTSLSDTLGGPDLDAAWHFLEYPMGEGAPPWVCREPDARVEVGGGACRVSVDRFALTHPVQPIDNCKFVALTQQRFEVPETGTITVSAGLSAAGIGASGDYRDGFAALVVLDLATGLVFDIGATGDQVLAIHEKLPMGEGPFTRVVDAPLAGIETGSDVVHRCAITLDRSAGSATWEVDGVRLFDAHAIAIPEGFVVGMGIFTLRPTHDAPGASIRGQGMRAAWSDIAVTAHS
ncbi:DUF6081 family protein [Tsukamurella spumae]|uniref:Uncharacterized protein n=1 Tax=Tsukamurella spumae TaxID=44753 RepID=A0A846X1V7_9ACTN|nr:DUF6081 family protein [Tsukamurella spumae]NKY19587.1 hypothetical protein [Tsukamurella spumae]